MRKKLLLFLGCSALIIGLAYAQGQITSYYKQKWLGINPRVNPQLLPDEDALSASNITLDETGAFKDRTTFSQYNTLSGVLGSNYLTGLFKYYTTTSKYFIACAGNKVALGNAGQFSTDITPTTNTVTLGKYWSASTFNNYEYMFNSSIPMMKYDPTRTALYAPVSQPATNCAYSAVHKARLWAARSDTTPYRLFFSSLNNGDDWGTTGGYIDLPDLSQAITGIISWGGSLWIFTETQVYVLQGSTPNDFSMKKTLSQVGAIAPRSIKITDVGIVFLSRSGVFAFDGNTSHKLSDKVEPLINNISKTQIQNACGLYDGQNKYWLAYTDGTSSYNNKIIIYDTILKEWYPYDNININYFERAYGGTDKGEIYGGSSVNNGIVWSLQESSGAESIVHDTKTAFDTGTTSNTVTTNVPSIILQTDYGTGYDGDWTIAGASNISTDTNGINGRVTADGISYAMVASVTAGATVVPLATTTGIAAGDDVLIINMQAPTSGNHGKWEVRKVSSVVTNTSITLVDALLNSYDGTADKIVVQRVPNYNNVTIQNGASLTASAWNGTQYGIVAFKCYGTLDINAGGTLNGSEIGYRGGNAPGAAPSSAGTQGESYTGTGGASLNANNGGGGSGSNSGAGGDFIGGGGGAGYATSGTTAGGQANHGWLGEGGGTYGNENLSLIYLGSGGGGGYTDTGGIGGGIICIMARYINIAGNITSSGGSKTYAGGGSGGSIYVKTTSAVLGAGLITANGGIAAATFHGDASVGRIAVDCYYLTGTTTPTYKQIDTYNDLTSIIGGYVSSGDLNSTPIQINAASQSALSTIDWVSTSPSKTGAALQTRTGVTNDTVYFNGWQYWSSANSVTLNTVTDATAIFTSSTNDGNFTVKKPFPAISRNDLFYEDEDSVSVNCVSINVVAQSKNQFIEAFIPSTNLTNYNWLEGWYKSPATGNSVEFYIGNYVSSTNYVTFNTVVSNSTVDGWQKWYWFIGDIPTTERDNVRYIKYRYTGSATGGLVFGEINARNYYTQGDTITSAPNDYIQYRAILATNDILQTPEINSITLNYIPSASASESSLSSSYKTKWIDFQTPQVDKYFLEFFADVYTENANGLFYFDYDIDNGKRTGTFTVASTSTVTNNVVKIHKYFPSSAYGKTMSVTYRNGDKDSKHTVRGVEIRYRPETFIP